MYNAPPVAYPVGRFIWGGVAWLGVSAVSALGLLAWSHLSLPTTVQSLAAWSCWGICGWGAALWGRHQTLSQGRLCWRGQAWSWQPRTGEEVDLQLTVGLDVGGGILLFLRLDPGLQKGLGPLHCAWASRSAMPPLWHGFRCAVYSRPRANSTIGAPGA